MQNSYLNVFNNMFFNVEEHEEVKNIIEQASFVFDSIITKFGEIQNEMTMGISKVDASVDRVIILFVRKIIEELDAINVLYSVCSFDVAQIVLRTLFENIVILEFILKDDTPKRAAAYFLEHHYLELDMESSPESEFGKLYIKQYGKEEFDKYCEKVEEKRKAMQRLINSNPIYQEIDKDRKKKLKKKKKGKNKVYINWYEVCSNVRSFMGLIREVGYDNYCNIIYNGLSFEVHALNTAMGMYVDEKGFSLKPIRNPEGGKSTFEITCTIAISALRHIYKYLEDGENEKAEFEDFYADYVIKRDIVCHNLSMIKR